jgi:uncharacterized membrane protein
VTARERRARAYESLIGRMIIVTTYAAVALLAVGVVLMVNAGISPLDGGPRLDPGAIIADVSRLDPAGFLWLGLIAVVATPVARVIAAAIAAARLGDRGLLGVAVAILVVIGLGVVSGLAGG